MRKISYLMIIMITSCSYLGQRTYLSEMEEDDSKMFEPKDDFRVVSGDSGKVGRSREAIRRRTPASTFEIQREKEKTNLKQSLKNREGKLTEEDLVHYEKYKKQLGGDSEKLYFLELPTRQDKEEYLMSRGIEDAPLFTHSPDSFLQPDSLDLGMSKEQVSDLWGDPARVEVAGNPRYENERWIYRKNGALKYIYFESGRVGGWSTGRP